MFGAVRGAWSSCGDEWRGRWGDEPPHHAPVFVMTLHQHPPVEMEGGRVTTGLEPVETEHYPWATHVRYRVMT
jgi:hypothetical protein